MYYKIINYNRCVIFPEPFLARNSIYAIARSLLTPVRPPVPPSVPLSVCHTGGSVKDG